MTITLHNETRNGIRFTVTLDKGHLAYRFKIEGECGRNFYATIKAAVKAARRHIDSKIIL